YFSYKTPMVTEDADESVTKEQLSKSGSQYWSRCYPLSFGENICDLFKGFLLQLYYGLAIH
ncbi:unnamed protein product, partial [Rotaria magnacalcarata]